MYDRQLCAYFLPNYRSVAPTKRPTVSPKVLLKNVFIIDIYFNISQYMLGCVNSLLFCAYLYVPVLISSITSMMHTSLRNPEQVNQIFSLRVSLPHNLQAGHLCQRLYHQLPLRCQHVNRRDNPRGNPQLNPVSFRDLPQMPHRHLGYPS